ncbi:MAG: type II secretion system protein [bacterium]|nr:type II secretion system protein [bacterium]
MLHTSERGFTRTNFSPENSRGFTLIEMLVAIGIFSIIMVISVGSLLSLIEANRKAQALKTVVNNLHFALENMSRNIRTGDTYHCGSGSPEEPLDCPDTSDPVLVFKGRQKNMFIAYKLNNGAIERSQDTNAGTLMVPSNFIPITAPEVIVNQLQFFVDGTENDDGKQPRVLIVVKGEMQGKSKVKTMFDIETLVSQRLLDIED